MKRNPFNETAGKMGALTATVTDHANGHDRGTGTCEFSNGARYQLHF